MGVLLQPAMETWFFTETSTGMEQALHIRWQVDRTAKNTTGEVHFEGLALSRGVGLDPVRDEQAQVEVSVTNQGVTSTRKGQSYYNAQEN